MLTFFPIFICSSSGIRVHQNLTQIKDMASSVSLLCSFRVGECKEGKHERRRTKRDSSLYRYTHLLSLLVSFSFNTVSRIPRLLLLVSWQTAISGGVKATDNSWDLRRGADDDFGEAPHPLLPRSKSFPRSVRIFPLVVILNTFFQFL